MVVYYLHTKLCTIFVTFLAEVLSSCPEKDTSCRTEDGSNVINVLSTISDGECGCESKVSHVWGVPKKWDVCSNGYNFSKIHQKLRKLGCLENSA